MKVIKKKRKETYNYNKKVLEKKKDERQEKLEMFQNQRKPCGAKTTAWGNYCFCRSRQKKKKRKCGWINNRGLHPKQLDRVSLTLPPGRKPED